MGGNNKLFIIQCVNGNMTIASEWTNNEQGARVNFHQTCATLWNSADVLNATVKLVNENMDIFSQEFIYHPLPNTEE